MSDPTPMSDDRLEEIRSVIEQAPQLVTDSIADDLLTEVDYQRAENERGQAFARLLDEATEANNTLSMSLEEEQELHREAHQEIKRLRATVRESEHLDIVLCGCGDQLDARHGARCGNCQTAHDQAPGLLWALQDLAHLRVTVRDLADAIAGRALTRAETDLLTRTLRTAAGDS